MRDYKGIRDDLINQLKSEFSKFAIKFKENSKFQKLLGKLAYPFNKRYMTDYVTTMAQTLWWPTEEMYENNPKAVCGTMLHERHHLWDRKKHPFWFNFSYLVILPLGWTMRAHWERRGYAASIMYYKAAGYEHDYIRDAIETNFVGASYFWMWPAKKKYRAWFDDVWENGMKPHYKYDEEMLVVTKEYIERLTGDES